MDKTKTKKETVKKQEFNHSQMYSIVGTGKSKHLAKGYEAEVGGETCELLINKGYAELK